MVDYKHGNQKGESQRKLFLFVKDGMRYSSGSTGANPYPEKEGKMTEKLAIAKPADTVNFNEIMSLRGKNPLTIDFMIFREAELRTGVLPARKKEKLAPIVSKPKGNRSQWTDNYAPHWFRVAEVPEEKMWTDHFASLPLFTFNAKAKAFEPVRRF
jgi:ribosomal protein L21